jgi:iron complex transport system ATP-binding protein
VIALRGVSVELGGVRVVEDVTAAVERGEWVTLIGRNGAGKTTLLRALAGLASASGSIEIGGEPVARLSRRRLAARVAYVPQTPLAPAEMRVDEYVLLGRTPHVGYFASESHSDRHAAAQALARLDLARLAHRRLGTLSGGERQRAILARALAQDAPVLLVDEPTSALDIGRQQQALELVDALRTEDGLTVVAAMHDLTLAAQYADRLLFLDRGRLVAAGTARDVLRGELIAEHYGAAVRVLDDPSGPVVVPARPAARTSSGP